MSFFLLYIEKLIKAGRLLSWDKVYIWKILSRYAGIPPSRDGMKNVPASYKTYQQTYEKLLYSSNLVYCPVPALI